MRPEGKKEYGGNMNSQNDKKKSSINFDDVMDFLETFGAVLIGLIIILFFILWQGRTVIAFLVKIFRS